MTQPVKNYSDPDDQRTLADALSQTSTYSPDNLVSALKKKDQQAKDNRGQTPQTYIPGQGMPPWAADAPPQAAPPQDNRGYLERGWDALKGANNAVGDAILHPGRTLGAAWDANKRAGQAVLDANSRAGQAVLDAGKPPPVQTPEQQAAANADRLKGIQLAPDQPQQAPGAADTPDQQAAPPPQAPPQTAPEHWVNTMDPASRAAMAAGQAQQLGGVGSQADAEAAAARDMADVARQGHDDARVQQLLDQQKLDPERQKLDEHARQLQAQAEKLATARVDPSHYLASAPAGAKVLMAIGSALSGFSAGLRGGPNASLEMIKGAIDDDNRAQMQNIENARGGVEQQKGILADKMRLFGNKEQALAATRQEQLQGVAAQIDDIARQYQSPEIQAKAQQLKGELQQHFAAEGASVNRYVPPSTTGGAPTQAQLEKEAFELVKGKDMAPEDAMKAVRYLHGMEATAPTGFYQAPGIGKVDPTAVANQGLQNIDALRDAHGNLPTTGLFLQQHGGGWVPVGTKARQLDGAITQLAEIQAKATGRATPQLIQQIKHTIIGNGSAVDVEAGIKRSRSLIQAGSATPLAGQGGAPGASEPLPGEAPL